MATVFIGADHGGVRIKDLLGEALRARGHVVEDLGTHGDQAVDYPDIAAAVARKVVGHDGARGLLVCGTGIGMSMTANKIRGVRAAQATDPFMARMATEHNDANVLCLGERVIGEGLALAILDAYLGATFGGGRHARRVGKIMEVEAG